MDPGPISNKDVGGSGGAARNDDATASLPSKRSKNKKTEKNSDYSEEDLALKHQLELYVEMLHSRDHGLRKKALEGMRHEIQTSTSSMTVRKPLKFLRPHYNTLKAQFKEMVDIELKKLLADILSVLAMTFSTEGDTESLVYKLLGSEGNIGTWGHEYVRHLDANIVTELSKEDESDAQQSRLLGLGKEIAAFYLEHNAEHEAVDLLIELRELDDIMEHIYKENYKRTCLYLVNTAKYLPQLESNEVLNVAYNIYLKYEEYSRSMQIALYLQNMELVKQVFTSCHDLLNKKQLCFIIGRHGFRLDEKMSADDIEKWGLKETICNDKRSEGYLELARDLEVMDPKTPKDIVKRDEWVPNLFEGGLYTPRLELAANYVNAFVNAGFCKDKLLTDPSESSGIEIQEMMPMEQKFSATASLGLIFLWEVDDGLAVFEKYYDSKDAFILAGALLGIGILNCNSTNEFEPALSLLSGYCNNEDRSIRIGAVMGLGLAYVGQENNEVRSLLDRVPSVYTTLDVLAFTTISLGLVYLGSGNDQIASIIILNLKERHFFELGTPNGRLMMLGLGLLYFGNKERVNVDNISEIFDVTVDTDSSRIGDDFDKANKEFKKIKKYLEVILRSCAYAGTGDVHMVQHFLHQCGAGLEKDESCQGPIVLAIAMVAMGEELGQEMVIRSLEDILYYGKPNMKRAVPLALGLISISNPKDNVMNTLSRISRGSDREVAMAAIIGLGLVGAGTNNARIVRILHDLSSKYYKDAKVLFWVRIAQGLVHLGKGLLTLSPYHCDQFLLSPVALSGLVIFLHACLDMEYPAIGTPDYVLYYLVLAMQPRMLMTVDENLNPLSLPVRVGKAVDASQPGRPKTITGSKTHSTPVILAAGEIAELATEKYLPLSPFLEGYVIVKENSDC